MLISGNLASDGSAAGGQSATTKIPLRRPLNPGRTSPAEPCDIATPPVRAVCIHCAYKFGIRLWSWGNSTTRGRAIGNPRTMGGNEVASVWAMGSVDFIDGVLRAGSDTASLDISGREGDLKQVIVFFGSLTRLDGDAALIMADVPGISELHCFAVNGTLRNRILMAPKSTEIMAL